MRALPAIVDDTEKEKLVCPREVSRGRSEDGLLGLRRLRGDIRVCGGVRAKIGKPLLLLPAISIVDLVVGPDHAWSWSLRGFKNARGFLPARKSLARSVPMVPIMSNGIPTMVQAGATFMR